MVIIIEEAKQAGKRQDAEEIDRSRPKVAC